MSRLVCHALPPPSPPPQVKKVVDFKSCPIILTLGLLAVGGGRVLRRAVRTTVSTTSLAGDAVFSHSGVSSLTPVLRFTTLSGPLALPPLDDRFCGNTCMSNGKDWQPHCPKRMAGVR